jgi:hypothetical protein
MAISGITKAYYHQLMSDVNQPAVKKHYVVDDEFDVTEEYIAQENAPASGVCIKHRLTYSGTGTSKYLLNEDYADAFWDSAWDII